MKTEDFGFYQVLKIDYDFFSEIQERGHQNVTTAAFCVNLFYLKNTMSQLMSQYVPFSSA